MNKTYVILIFLFILLSCRSQEVINLKSINNELKNVLERDNKSNNLDKDNIEARERAFFEIIELRKEFFSKVNIKKSDFKLIETKTFNNTYTCILFLDNDVFHFIKKKHSSIFEETTLDTYSTNNPNSIHLFIIKKLNQGKIDELIDISNKSRNSHGDSLIITTTTGKVTSYILNTFFIKDEKGKLLYW